MEVAGSVQCSTIIYLQKLKMALDAGNTRINQYGDGNDLLQDIN